MNITIKRHAFFVGAIISSISLVLLGATALRCEAGPASEHLPKHRLISSQALKQPVMNAAFLPSGDAAVADSFHKTVKINNVELQFDRPLAQPICDGQPVKLGGSCRGGHDKRMFPEITLELFTLPNRKTLAMVQRGTMVVDSSATGRKSYWHVIAQYGSVWKEPSDGEWSRAAFPIMLVNYGENVAHHGLATFLYHKHRTSRLILQFVQQSTPWNTPEHFIAWGSTQIEVVDDKPSELTKKQRAATHELNNRLKHQPLALLERQYPPRALKGFAGPLSDRWITMKAIVKEKTLYYQDVETPYGNFPYPQEMRFGIRSMAKSITVPLALARLAQVYGPYVLNLPLSRYIQGLHPGYKGVRFIDAANMATGMGDGSTITHPNNGYDGYVDDTYDEWYNGALSAKDKIDYINRDTHPYPWRPGVVYRYRDRDYHLLGAAMDSFLKHMRGPQANIWEMLEKEVFLPIHIYQAPIVKTIEPKGKKGLAWFHAGLYPTLDDLAKVALLYQNHGRHGGQQILHAGVVAQIFSTEGALIKDYDHSLDTAFSLSQTAGDKRNKKLYKLGFHYEPYTDQQGNHCHVPVMYGFSENQLIFHPNQLVSIRLTKAWPLPDDEKSRMGAKQTITIINQL